MQAIKPVVFKLNDEEYGVDINKVHAIENIQDITRIPNALSCIKGILNLRGDIIPVYDIRKRFGLEPVKDRKLAKLIVIKTKDMNIALEVDSVAEIDDIEGENIHNVPSIVRSKDTAYIDKIANVDGHLIVILNLDELLTEQEYKEAVKIIEE